MVDVKEIEINKIRNFSYKLSRNFTVVNKNAVLCFNGKMSDVWREQDNYYNIGGIDNKVIFKNFNSYLFSIYGKYNAVLDKILLYASDTKAVFDSMIGCEIDKVTEMHRKIDIARLCGNMDIMFQIPNAVDYLLQLSLSDDEVVLSSDICLCFEESLSRDICIIRRKMFDNVEAVKKDTEINIKYTGTGNLLILPS